MILGGFVSWMFYLSLFPIKSNEVMFELIIHDYMNICKPCVVHSIAVYTVYRYLAKASLSQLIQLQ